MDGHLVINQLSRGRVAQRDAKQLCRSKGDCASQIPDSVFYLQNTHISVPKLKLVLKVEPSGVRSSSFSGRGKPSSSLSACTIGLQ